MFSGFSSQLFYFYIICYYLKLKQREVNNYLRKIIENKERIKIYNSNEMIAKLNIIYEKIKEYDSQFWSKFLALIWICCTIDIAIGFSMIALSNNIFFQIKFGIVYGISILLCLLFLIIWMCGSVNYESKVT